MKKCQTCRYGSEYELDKPCIVYREDCPLYQKVGDEMTREEAIKYFEHHMEFYCVTGVCKEAEEMAIKALKQEPSGDLISRQAVIELLFNAYTKTELTSIGYASKEYAELCVNELMELPSIHPQEPKTGYCKDCKYFEYDSVAKVDGIPLIVAHEICSRWGDGCKTKEDGYCFLFERGTNNE